MTDLAALWCEALAAHEIVHGPGPSTLQLAADGHPNRDAILRAELADATDASCPCGEDEPCPGVVVDTPARRHLAACLRRLAAALELGPEAAP